MKLRMTRGNTASFLITAVDSTGQPLDLTGAGLWFTVKKRLSDSDVDAVIQKTTDGGGITVSDNPMSGLATIAIDPDDTSGLSTLGQTLHWDLQIVGNTGDIYTLAIGLLRVVPDVTESIV